MEEVGHEIFADGRYEVAGLIEIFFFPRVGRHVGDFADVDEVFWVQFELGMSACRGESYERLRDDDAAYLDISDTSDRFHG